MLKKSTWLGMLVLAFLVTEMSASAAQANFYNNGKQTSWGKYSR